MFVVINPGSGPVAGGSEEQAVANIATFVEDLGLDAVSATKARHQPENGRVRFLLARGERGCDVEMPGLSLERVRFMDEGGQSAWNFPRLYVDGSSWLWCFALSMAREALLGEEQP